MIQVTNLRFSYPGSPLVLKDLCFKVKPGEIFGVIGPNGSGKTTLLKVLSGFLGAYSGNIRLLGRSLKSYTQKELAVNIAVVPQETHVSFPFSALDIVLMGRSPHLGRLDLEAPYDLDIARHAMAKTDTLQFADRHIQELSGGEKQRVIFARALAQRTQILILDEPTAFLDIKHQISMCNLLRRLNQQEGKTILVVFHDLNLAAMYCHRLMLLDRGRVFRIGRPDKVITYSAIKATYSTEVYVGINDLTGSPYYMPMKNESQMDTEEGTDNGN